MLIYVVMYDCVTAVWDYYAVMDIMTMVMVMMSLLMRSLSYPCYSGHCSCYAILTHMSEIMSLCDSLSHICSKTTQQCLY